jgi:hypothetical protein
MKFKMIKAAFAGLILTVSGFANAGIIYNFVCDDSTCGGIQGWGGSFEIDAAAVARGSLVGTDDILNFTFLSPDKGGIVFTLANLIDSIAMTFSNDGSVILSITDNGINISCPASGPEACFLVRPDALFVDASFVNDVNFNYQTGIWVSNVPEPSTLAILALGLFGLGARRFKK